MREHHKINDNLVVFPREKTLAVRAINRAQTTFLSRWRHTIEQQDDLFLVPWDNETCKILYDSGVPGILNATPLCFEGRRLYEGRYPFMQHQYAMASFMLMNERGFNLAECRLGKTGGVILGIDYMQRHGMITGGVLIITTLTTILSVWKTCIEETVPGARVEVVHGKTREQALDRVADFYITNYDSCRLSEKAFMRATEAERIGAVVIDEVTHVGNSTSQRHKAIYRICNSGMRYVWGLTGSPADNPESVYGMCRCVNPKKLPCATKGSWLTLTTFNYGPEPYMRKPNSQAPEIIHRVMQPAIRFAKKDILDLPPVTTQVRTCQLSASQKHVYEELRQEAISLLESGVQITAVNGGVLLAKLMQVALGAVKDATGQVHELNHTDRLATILDAIEETPNKVVIFCGYIASIDMLVKELRQFKHTAEKIDGSVTGKARADILRRFQYEADPRVLVCHPTTTAMGVELSAADTMIFNGVPMTGGFVYAQSVERLSSTKQKAGNINIIHVLATKEEQTALRHMQEGHDLGQQIASMFSEFVHNK